MNTNKEFSEIKDNFLRIANEEAYQWHCPTKALDYLERAVASLLKEAVEEREREIIALIEDRKEKGYEANTILESVVSELKIGSKIKSLQ